MLHTHRLPQQQLQEVARATTLASLLYTSPAWSSTGFTTIRDRERLECLVGRLQRGGISQWTPPSFVQMVESAEKRLFRAIVTNPSHLLHHALPKKSPPSTTCALEPTTLSYRGRTLGTFWPAGQHSVLFWSAVL